MAKKTTESRMTPGEAMEAARAMARGRAAPKPLTGANPGPARKAPAPAPPSSSAARPRASAASPAGHLTAVSLAYARNAYDVAQRGLGDDDPRAEAVMEEGGQYTMDVIRTAMPSQDPLTRDPIEEMLVTQILIAHARSARYAELAALQTDIVNTKCLAAAADGAANVFRRLVATLVDYRHPTRGAAILSRQTNIAATQQVNQAEQQVVNPDFRNEKPSNQKDAAGPAAAVPAHAGGAGVTPGVNLPQPTLALPDARGAEAVGPQRDQARDAVGGVDGRGGGAADGDQVPAASGRG